MGAWGEKVWENDSALDTVGALSDNILHRMEEASKHEYDKEAELMALIECYLSLPIIDREARQKIAPYMEIIEAENYELWKDQDVRTDYVANWLDAVRAKLQHNEENPFSTTLLDKIAEVLG